MNTRGPVRWKKIHSHTALLLIIAIMLPGREDGGRGQRDDVEQLWLIGGMLRGGMRQPRSPSDHRQHCSQRWMEKYEKVTLCSRRFRICEMRWGLDGRCWCSCKFYIREMRQGCMKCTLKISHLWDEAQGGLEDVASPHCWRWIPSRLGVSSSQGILPCCCEMSLLIIIIIIISLLIHQHHHRK